MKYLVTGGAGYIGSFMVNALLERGDEVVVLDNLSRGHKSAVNSKAIFIEGRVGDSNVINNIFSEHKIDGIFHFAGLISVEESTKNPDLYFENNVEQTKVLIDAAVLKGINKFIFSSTAAVYGNPSYVPIPEDHPKHPTSPYGESKLMVEEYLSSVRKTHPEFGFVCLRYFNACGDALDGRMGEDHVPETHIIPLAIKALIDNKTFKIFGDNYDTPDRTCLRDYIHVLDLVEAHILALKRLESKTDGLFYNVGTGNGISNMQIVNEIEAVSGRKIQIEFAPRRPGDADRLIADVKKIQDIGFIAKYSDIKTIIESAWKWHTKNEDSN